MDEASRTPRSVKRHPANGAARYVVEVRMSHGWSFRSSRTTLAAGLDLLASHAEHPRRSEDRGAPVRLRDSIDNVTEASREGCPADGWSQ